MYVYELFVMRVDDKGLPTKWKSLGLFSSKEKAVLYFSRFKSSKKYYHMDYSTADNGVKITMRDVH